MHVYLFTWTAHSVSADVEDDAEEEAAMELRPCTEPGHYVRSSSAFTMVPETMQLGFELQIVLTEDELQSLKVPWWRNQLLGTDMR